jgi:PKD repeat protein
LNADGSADTDGSIVSWEWDFGSGFGDYTATQGAANHTFALAGEHQATLRVTDELGASATDTVAINVEEQQSGWTHSYGLALGDEALATVVDAAGNVYLAGRHAMPSGGATQRGLLLSKFSAAGALLWAKTFAATGASSFVDTSVNGMALDPVNGGVVVLSTSNALGVGSLDFVLTKINPNGMTLWSKSWGGSGSETASALSIDGAGFIYACGTSAGFGGGTEVAVVKFSPTGSLFWQRLWGSAGSEAAHDVLADADSVYVLASASDLGPSRSDPVLLRYSANGTFQWSKGYSGDVAVRSLARDGSALLLAGNTHNGDATLPGSLLAARLDSAGNLLWSTAWGSGQMQGRDVAVSPKGIHVSGTAGVDGVDRAVVARFRTDGTFGAARQWNAAVGGANGNGLAVDATGGVQLAGSAASAAGAYSAAAGAPVAAPLTPFTPAGLSRAPMGASTFAFGLEEPAMGVLDTGGGGSDMLALQGFQQ